MQPSPMFQIQIRCGPDAAAPRVLLKATRGGFFRDALTLSVHQLEGCQPGCCSGFAETQIKLRKRWEAFTAAHSECSESRTP